VCRQFRGPSGGPLLSHGNDDARLEEVIHLVQRLRDVPMKEICRDPRDGTPMGNGHVVRSSAVKQGLVTPATPDGRLAGTPLASSVAAAVAERPGAMLNPSRWTVRAAGNAATRSIPLTPGWSPSVAEAASHVERVRQRRPGADQRSATKHEPPSSIRTSTGTWSCVSEFREPDAGDAGRHHRRAEHR
jgi:hypothetical protein